MHLIIYKTNPKEKEEKGVPLVVTIIPDLIVLVKLLETTYIYCI